MVLKGVLNIREADQLIRRVNIVSVWICMLGMSEFRAADVEYKNPERRPINMDDIEPM